MLTFRAITTNCLEVCLNSQHVEVACLCSWFNTLCLPQEVCMINWFGGCVFIDWYVELSYTVQSLRKKYMYT